MKKIILTISAAIISLTSFSQAGKNDCVQYPALIDSVLVARWNPDAMQWIDESIRHYSYSADRLESILYMNAARIYQSRWTDSWDSYGNVIFQFLTTWNGSAWVESQKKTSEFDSFNRKQNELILNFRNGAWIFRAYYEYEYSDGSISQIIYKLQDQSGNLYDHMYYNYTYVDGRVSEIATYDPAKGSTIRIEKYYRDAEGKVIEVTLWQLSTDGSGSYVPQTRRVYSYSEFSLLREVVLSSWDGSAWVNSTRSVYYRKIDTAKKVAICHNGHTICISINALHAHLAIGSILGICSSESNRPGSSSGTKDSATTELPFKIFPTPATDRVSIRFKNGINHGIRTIELADFSGKIIRKINVRGQEEITFLRHGLQDGKYLLRFSGKHIYQAVVIFE
jgi:hypothetical protein